MPEPKKPTIELSTDVKLKQLEAVAEAALAEEEGDEVSPTPNFDAAIEQLIRDRAPRNRLILGSPEPRMPTREYHELRDFRGQVIQRVVTRVIPAANSGRVHYHYIGGPEHGRQVTEAMRVHDTIRTSHGPRMQSLAYPGARGQDYVTVEYHMYYRRDYCLHGEFIVVFVSQDLRDEDIPQYIEETAAI